MIDIKQQWIIIIFLIITITGCKQTQTINQDDHTDHTHHENINYFGSYTLTDEEYGTKTVMTLNDQNRVMVTNALPNHQTGKFPNANNPNTISAQERTHTFPLKPEYTGNPQWVREPGVALNGVKFEPETAEVVVCESGEQYRIEAKQEHFKLGLDDNNAHVQPTGEYHYHGTPNGMIDTFDSGEDLVHIGFAHDGFPIYYSKSNAYSPSFELIGDERTGTDCDYTNPHQSTEVEITNKELDGVFKSDWQYVSGKGDLDECNGININGSYMYLITNSYPFVGRCLNGKIDSNSMRGPRGSRSQGGRPPRHNRKG